MPNDQAAVPAVAEKPALMATFTPKDEFELALRQAKVYAASTIVPKEYQDNLPNCLVALNMAKRIGADPLQVLQNLYIVHGRPGWSAQFLIATFNQCGKFTAMRFEWKGEAGTDDYGCRAYATEKATGDKIVGPWVTMKLVKSEGWWDRKDKNGNIATKWRTLTDLMFHYRAASYLVRTHAPELAMGLQTAEELDDVIDITPEREASTSAIDKAKADITATLNPVSEGGIKADPATGELLPAA